MKKETIIAKNKTYCCATDYENASVEFYDSNLISKIIDNTKGLKGSPDYFIYFRDGNVAEVMEINIIDIPYTEFIKNLKRV